MSEIWKSVVGFYGYEVSNRGRVRSVDRKIRTKNGQTRFYKGRILGQAIDGKGYSRVCLWEHNHQFGHLVHRLVAGAFLRKIGRGEEVNHLDFDKQNNNDGNLEIGTRQDNSAHATVAGRMAKKLTEEEVREIKYSRLWGEDKYDLAARFDVSRVTINNLAWSRSWQRVSLSEWLSAHD